MNDPIRVHASGIKLLRLCPRRAWYSQAGAPGDDSAPSLLLGTAVHEILEGVYGALRDSEPEPAIDTSEDAGRIAAQQWALRRALDRDGDWRVLDVEKEFTLDVDGVTYGGTIDLIVEVAGRVVVIDHKTCSNLKYAHTPETLATDPQAIIYAHATGASEVWFSYLPSKGRGQPRVVKTVPRSIETLAEEATAIVSLPILRPEEVPANTDACSAYGRPCPYLAFCPVKGLPTFKEEKPMSMKDIIEKAKQKAAQAGQHVAPEAGPNPHETIPAPPPEMEPEPDEPEPERKASRILLVGCFVEDHGTTRPTISAWPIVLGAMREVARGAGVTHYKEAPFGKGPGMLCNAVAQALENLDGTILIDDPYASGVSDALPAFVEWSHLRFRSFR